MKMPEKTGAVLIVGGGIAGIQSALDAANAGFRVYLVERSPSIGGVMAQLDKTFPTNDCAMCILAPKMVEVAHQPNIRLLTYSEVKGVSGAPGDFIVRVLRKPRYIDHEKCTGCGTCTQVCPVRNVPQPSEAGPVGPTIEEEKRQKYDGIINRYPDKKGALVPVLQDINAEFRHLPEEALRYVSERLEIPLSKVYHVATFFTSFSLKPRGRHTVKVCLGTACHVRGSKKVLEAVERNLGVGPGETTPDREFTLETVNCLGACALGPVVVVDEEYYPMSVGKVDALLDKFRGAKAGPEEGGGE